jgi:hypothetical protein
VELVSPAIRIYLHGIGDHADDWFARYRGLLPSDIGRLSVGFHYEDFLEQSVWGRGAKAGLRAPSLLEKLLPQGVGGPWRPVINIGLEALDLSVADWLGEYAADVPAYLKDTHTMNKVLTRLHYFIHGFESVELHGHSLGAAVADEYCRKTNDPKVVKLVTYGAPQGKRLARTILERRSGPPSEVQWVNYHGVKDWVAGYPFPTPWGRPSTGLPYEHYPNVVNRELGCGHDLEDYLRLSV